jgi:signal transduction histidine kinase/ligand-binding sensor domain-containing protein/DNA-binding response OmpR family regulator
LKRFCILIWLLWHGALWGLDPHKPISEYVHTVWRSEDGLPQNSIQAVLQTSDGYLWIGTQEGLVRFNGVEFKVFNKDNTDAIRHNDVRVLYQDSRGTLWIGTFGGGIASYRDGQFTAYSVRNGLSNNSVTTILQDHNGDLWVGTINGLNRFTGGRFEVFTRKEGLSDNEIQALAEDAHGRLLIATGSGLDAMSGGRISDASQSISKKSAITVLFFDRQQNLWIGTEGHDLSVSRSGKMFHYGKAQGLPDAPIHTIFQDNQGTIWIGTQGKGICRLASQRFECYSIQNGLSGDYVETITQDREGNLWVGTETGGLNRFKEGPLASFGSELGLTGSPRTLFEDGEGNLWIGTSTGLWRVKNGKAVPYLTDGGPANNYTYSMIRDRQGNVWVGTNEGGLNEFTGHSVKTYRKADGLADDWVPTVYQDHTGDVWAGTFAGGISRFHHGRIQNYTVKEGLGSNRVWAIYEDSAKNLWFGTDAGLSLFRDGRFTNFDLQEPSEETPSMGGVMVIYEDAEHFLWIGTYGAGLKRFKDGKFLSIGQKQGLFDDTIWSILEDDLGNFWMSSNRGIFKIKKSEVIDVMEGRRKKLQSQAFGVADGMVSSECNGGSQYSGWKTHDGKLLFACLKNVVMVDPGNLSRNPLPPPVVIEGVRINQREKVSPGANIPAGAGEVEFHYAALSYFAPEKVAFKCKLEPYDDDWFEPATPRVVRYTNLSPGQYTFRVMAANNDGVWNRQGATFSFYLEPRFYQTTWFYSLCGLMLVLSPIGVYLLRMRQIRLRERELVVLVGKRTRELQAAKELAEAATHAKSGFLANMSHEIRTPLNGVAGMLDLISQSELTTDQKQLLGMARDSANTLMVVINDILDFSKIEAGKLAFENREFDLMSTVAEAARTMAVPAHQKGLELVYQVDPAIPRYLVGDAGRLKQVLHNLIGNAVKFTSRGEIVLRVNLESRLGDEVRLHFAVTDTGIGISPEQQKLIFEPFSQADASTSRKFGGTGLGLAISQRIVELMGGSMGVTSSLGTGSTFYFTARMYASHNPTAGAELPQELRGAPVLVVDDNQSSRAILEQMLSAMGMKAAGAASAQDALALLKTDADRYRLLLIDSRMPEMDGFTLAGQLAGRGEKVAVLMMLSSDDYNASVQRCRELGINSYLIKPIKPCELLQAIGEMLAPTAKQTTRRSLEDKPLLPRLSVLVAEDNVVNQRLAVRLLEKMGHRIVVAQNGAEALTAAKNESFDLILMDVQMPEVDGLAATQEIRRWEQGHRSHVPIIAMTAHTMQGDRENCVAAGMDGYIAKPLEYGELQRTIEEVMKAGEAV